MSLRQIVTAFLAGALGAFLTLVLHASHWLDRLLP